MRLFLVTNFVVFQLCWLLAATYQQNSVLMMFGLLCIHFLFSPTKLADIQVLPIALVGIVVDQLLINVHVILLPVESSSLMMPLWLMLLWCSFSWCLNHSLQWLVKLSQFKIAIIGGVFGSLSYSIAFQLNVFTSALSLPYFVLTLAFIWALLLPFFVRMHLFIFK